MEFEFSLDKPIETLDNVPAEYHGYYEQSDTGFAVSSAFKPVAKQINGLSKNLRTARSSLTKANGEAADRRVKLGAFDGIFDAVGDAIDERDPEKLQAYIADLQTKAQASGQAGEEAAAQIEAIKRTMTAAQTEALAAKDSDIAERDTTIKTLLVDNNITRCLVNAEGNPKLLTPMLAQECEVRMADDGSRTVVILGDDGQPRYNSAGDLFTIEERVEELKADPAFQPAFNGQVKGGADTKTTQVVKKSQGGFDHSKANGKSLIGEGLRKRRAR